MHKATKTLEAIQSVMNADQGAKFRALLRETMPTAEDAYRAEESEFRAHLGASIIGRECAREVWYSFNWCTSRRFDARILRLFNRGHLEEPRMVALLKMIGCTVHQFNENGKQFRISGHKGHYGGSLDGVVIGCPDAPDTPLLGEFKTYNQKQFDMLQDKGVMAAHWEHFVQMQQYMGKMNLTGALYMGVNKNTDEIHAELVAFDLVQYQRYVDRSIQIIDSRTPPPRISDTPGFWKCKFCDHSPVCHQDKVMPARNCRTCIHSRPIENGEWVCTEPMADAAYGDNVPLNEAAQLKGCENYEMNPAIKGKV